LEKTKYFQRLKKIKKNMPIYLKLTTAESLMFTWNGFWNDEKVKEKDRSKLLSKIAIGKMQPFYKELEIDKVMIGQFTIITPKYSFKINHLNIIHSENFSSTLDKNVLTINGALLAKVSLKEDAIEHLQENIKIAHISQVSVWRPISHSQKNFYTFTKTGVWKTDLKIEQEILSGKHYPERSIVIEISKTKIKM